MTSPAPGAPAKRGKGALITGAVLLVLGILATFLGIAVFAGTAKELAGTTVSAPKATPAEFTEELAANTTYAVYEETGSATTITPADVSVTSDGSPITVKPAASNVTAKGEGGKTYTEIATFQTGTSGTFLVKVTGAGAVVAIAPSISVVSQGLAWGAAAILGVVLGFVGVILLIVGAVQRARS